MERPARIFQAEQGFAIETRKPIPELYIALLLVDLALFIRVQGAQKFIRDVVPEFDPNRPADAARIAKVNAGPNACLFHLRDCIRSLRESSSRGLPPIIRHPPCLISSGIMS
jgi:hypothetical protein